MARSSKSFMKRSMRNTRANLIMRTRRSSLFTPFSWLMPSSPSASALMSPALGCFRVHSSSNEEYSS